MARTQNWTRRPPEFPPVFMFVLGIAAEMQQASTGPLTGGAELLNQTGLMVTVDVTM